MPVPNVNISLANSELYLNRIIEGRLHPMHVVFHPDLLNCLEFRSFWIRKDLWNNWHIGTGYPSYENPIFSYKDEEYVPVYGVTFTAQRVQPSSYNAEWEYNRDEGNSA
jgi:hypothetical protein